MNEDREQEILELMDDMADDLRKKRSKSDPRGSGLSPGISNPKRTLILAIGTLLVFGILLILLIRGITGPSSTDTAPLMAKISQLEERLGGLEGISERVGRLEKEGDGIRQSLERVEKSIKGLKAEVSEKSGKGETLAKEAGVSGEGSRPSAAPSSSKKYHTVRRGESLYGIAKKYGVTIDDLRRLNKDLSKNRPIIPGQKILVGM